MIIDNSSEEQALWNVIKDNASTSDALSRAMGMDSRSFLDISAYLGFTPF